MFQNKMSKTSIIFYKPKTTLHSYRKSMQVTKTAVKFWYDLIKYIFIKVNIIRIFSGHAVFSYIYKNYKYFLAVETYDILMATHIQIFFERLMQ